MHFASPQDNKFEWTLIFLQPLKIVLKGWAARNQNVLPFSQQTGFLGLSCTVSHFIVLTRTPGICKKASRQKIKNPFQLKYFFSANRPKIELYSAKAQRSNKKAIKKNTKISIEGLLSKFCQGSAQHFKTQNCFG